MLDQLVRSCSSEKVNKVNEWCKLIRRKIKYRIDLNVIKVNLVTY